MSETGAPRRYWLPQSAGARVSTIVELIDLYPTVAELAGECEALHDVRHPLVGAPLRVRVTPMGSKRLLQVGPKCVAAAKCKNYHDKVTT